MRTNQLFLCAVLLCAGSTTLLSQKDYGFVSTGQQKSLVNPALTASTDGLSIQTLGGYIPNTYLAESALYSGVSYGSKKWSFGLSNTYYQGTYFYNDYYSNQADLSVSYKIKLSSKVTLVPSLQLSYIEKSVDLTNFTRNDWELYNPIGCFGPIIRVPEFETYYGSVQKKQNLSFSGGLLLDINKILTFGVAIYDATQPDVGILEYQKLPLTQHYHVSVLLFKDKKVNLAPYSILKLQGGGMQKYYELGAYTSYKMISLHTGLKNQFVYAHVQDHLDFVRLNDMKIVAGVNVSYKGIKLGYTISSSLDMYNKVHEVFLAAALFNKNNRSKSNLMLN